MNDHLIRGCYLGILGIIFLFFSQPVCAQTPITFVYGTANTAQNYAVTTTTGFTLAIGDPTALTPDIIKNFESQTIISWKSGTDQVSKKLIDFMNSLPPGTVSDKLATTGVLTIGDLSKMESKSITITPFLGSTITPAACTITLSDPITPPTQTQSTQSPFFDPATFVTGDMTEQEYIDKKYDNLVIYYPCTNTYTIYRKGKPKKAFWYKGTGNTGHASAIFLIDNFNTAVYNVSATNTFISYASSIPSVFSTVAGLITTPSVGGTGNTGTADPLAEFSNYIYLNTSIKQLLAYNCGNFKDAKRKIVAYVNQKFPYGINTCYQDFITANTTATVTKDVLKKSLTDKYTLFMSPDSVVKQDVQLYTALQNTSFVYQYNVIQLQNVDQIQFTVNISPIASTSNTSTNAGFLNVVSQNLNVPVLGGLKFDFSTGFYYSSIKNQTYALYNNPNPVSTTTPVSIIRENNSKGGAAGVDGLIHVYYPFAESWTPDLCVGVGASTALNYSLLAGGGFMFNVAGQNKISVSGGYNLSSIKKLSNAEIGSDGNPINVPLATTTITYASNFKRGCFFSLTYSFGLSKASQPASSAAPSSTPAAATGAASTSPAGGGGSGGGGGHSHQ